ncbi:MAG: amidohydrolase family protein, partial [Lachnospiraceae bacterium]|nr:amidohydrolase family protein [Lachnospiraceae bacterium]
LSKVREMDAASIKADEILYAATAGGAKAMGLSYCDRLEAGKKADIIMIDLKQPNMQPENNLVKNLVYAGGKQNVVLTMVNGRILYENGKYDIGFDPAEIYAKANAVIQRMQ